MDPTHSAGGETAVFQFNVVCTALFAALNIAVGLRLLLLARRTRGIPELSLGAAFLLQYGIGYPQAWIIHVFGLVPEPIEAWLSPFWRLATYAGIVALLFFVWRVFRARERWAAVVFVVCSLVLAGCFVAQELQGGYKDPTGRPWEIPFAIGGATFLWAAGESFHYYRVMSARARLGLGNPLVARRFLLWALGCLCTIPPHFTQIGVQLIYGRETFDPLSPTTALLSASLVSAGVLILLAFSGSATPRDQTVGSAEA